MKEQKMKELQDKIKRNEPITAEDREILRSIFHHSHSIPVKNIQIHEISEAEFKEKVKNRREGK